MHFFYSVLIKIRHYHEENVFPDKLILLMVSNTFKMLYNPTRYLCLRLYQLGLECNKNSRESCVNDRNMKKH